MSWYESVLAMKPKTLEPFRAEKQRLSELELTEKIAEKHQKIDGAFDSGIMTREDAKNKKKEMEQALREQSKNFGLTAMGKRLEDTLPILLRDDAGNKIYPDGKHLLQVLLTDSSKLCDQSIEFFAEDLELTQDVIIALGNNGNSVEESEPITETFTQLKPPDPEDTPAENLTAEEPATENASAEEPETIPDPNSGPWGKITKPVPEDEPPKRKRGRPPGSTKKKKQEQEAKEELKAPAVIEVPSTGLPPDTEVVNYSFSNFSFRIKSTPTLVSIEIHPDQLLSKKPGYENGHVRGKVMRYQESAESKQEVDVETKFISWQTPQKNTQD
jgi:hypothetical protein